MKYALKKTALIIGLVITLPVMASETTITPQVLYSLSESNGIFAPPVWSPQQQLIIGSTRVGGEKYAIPGYMVGMPPSEPASGLAYSLSLDGSDFNSRSLGWQAGSFLTSHLLSKSGDVWGGSTSAASSPVAVESLRWGAVTKIGNNLAVTSYRPDGLSLDKQFQVRGQLAEDSAGNIYVADGYASPATETVNKTNRLLRIKPGGVVETVIDYLQYAKPFHQQGINLRNWLSKGNAPYAIVWSDTDDAVYLISNTATGTLVEPHAGTPAVLCEEPPAGGEFFRPDCRDGTQLRGHLTRISGDALRGNLPVAEEDIQILFHFTVGTGGEVSTSDSNNLVSVIESGDFLYGISTTVKDENGSGHGIWRIRKSGLAEGETVADTFTTVHRFTNGETVYGPMVLAADGNIYGTTQTGGDNSAGTIYRINVGEADDRSDDELEQVYSFVETETGKTPKGLSAGPVQNGKQIIIGATAAGTEEGNGGIFTFEVTPLPGSLILEASATDVQPGDEITLTWSSERAQSCTASASATDVTDWMGNLAVSGSQTITAVAGTTDYTINCEGFDGEPLAETVRVKVVEPAAPKKKSSSGSFGWLLLPMLGLLALRRRT